MSDVKEELEKFENGDYDFFASEIKKEFGDVLREADDFGKPEVNFSGSSNLDISLTYPIPEGKLVEVFGPESCGKTTLCLEILGQAQSRGKTVAYVNVERAANKLLFNCIKTLDISKKTEDGNPTFIIIEGESGEQNLKIVEKFLQQFPKGVIVIDSVDALVPEAILQNEIGDATMGKLAKLMSDACRKLMVTASKTGCTAVFINQVRDTMSMYGPKTTTPGGRALRFYCDQRIELKKPTKADFIVDDDGKKNIGHFVSYTIVKNRFAPSGIEGRFPLLYGKGVWREYEVAALLCDLGLVEVGGKGGKQVKLSDEHGFMKVERAAKLFESDPVLFKEKRKLLLDNFFPR